MKRLLVVFLSIGLIIILFNGCLPNIPSEGEGEGEPEPAPRVVMVELFMAIGCGGCAIVEPRLEQLVEEYTFDQMILVEEAAWGEYSTSETSNRYPWYVPNKEDRGVPHIFFDGVNEEPIQGSLQATLSNLRNRIDAELAKGSPLLINIDSRESTSTNTTINGSIQNVSDSTLNNLVINGMTFKALPNENLKYLVVDIWDEQKFSLSSLEPEEIFTFTFVLEGLDWEGENRQGVIFVQAPLNPTKEVLQSIYID